MGVYEDCLQAYENERVALLSEKESLMSGIGSIKDAISKLQSQLDEDTAKLSEFAGNLSTIESNTNMLKLTNQLILGLSDETVVSITKEFFDGCDKQGIDLTSMDILSKVPEEFKSKCDLLIPARNIIDVTLHFVGNTKDYSSVYGWINIGDGNEPIIHKFKTSERKMNNMLVILYTTLMARARKHKSAEKVYKVLADGNTAGAYGKKAPLFLFDHSGNIIKTNMDDEWVIGEFDKSLYRVCLYSDKYYEVRSCDIKSYHATCVEKVFRHILKAYPDVFDNYVLMLKR